MNNILHGYGYSQGENSFKSKDYNIKVAVYSDFRVTPFKVASFKERIEEGLERYSNNKEKVKRIKDFYHFWEEVEVQIFKNCQIKPQDITNEKVEPMLEILRNYEINQQI